MSGIVNDSMNKGSTMDSEDRIEKTVDLYISAEAVRDMKHEKDKEDFNTTKTQTPQQTDYVSRMEGKRLASHLSSSGSDGVKTSVFRAAVVCLVLLCVLLLTAVIVLCVHIHTKSTNYTQLLTKITNLTEERDQLLTNNMNLTEERKQLLTKNMNLTKERDQLKSEKRELQKLSAGGWKCHQSSLYFLSSEKKNWAESRRNCTDRGADLISINNREEQDFVQNISGGDLVWIGLNDIDVEGSWKWVDGSNGTFRFWQPGQPDSNGGKNEDCALNHSPGWGDYPCDKPYKWICEKNIFK